MIGRLAVAASSSVWLRVDCCVAASGVAEGHDACADVGEGREPGRERERVYIQRQEEILIRGSRLTFQAFRRLGRLKDNVLLRN